MPFINIKQGPEDKSEAKSVAKVEALRGLIHQRSSMEVGIGD